MTYDFISNILEAEAASLGYHTHTRDEKAPKSGVKGAGGIIFTGFTQIGLSYWMERINISSMRGRDSTSRAEGSASILTRKTEQVCIYPVQKEIGQEDPMRDLIFESQV